MSGRDEFGEQIDADDAWLNRDPDARAATGESAVISDEANHMLSGLIARMIKAHPPDEPRRYADGRIEPARSPYKRNALDEEVRRIASQFDLGGTYTCPMPDCTWKLDVPVPTSSMNGETHAWTMNGYSRDDVERVLAAHVDSHARDDGERRP